MENILDFYVLGIYSAKKTASELLKHWGTINGKRLAGRIACLNDELKNELLKILGYEN